MKATVAASSRVLMQLSTAPAIGTPKCASTIGGVLGSITATVSPSPMSRAARAEASCRARKNCSFQLRRMAPCTIAQCSG